jgi:uncharacterized membrane protein
VLYGLGLVAVISLIHLHALSSSSTQIPTRAPRTHATRRTAAATVFAVATVITFFALLSALMFHIRTYTLPRFLQRADRELQLEPRNRTPWEQLRARHDNTAAILRQSGQWDMRTHFSQKVRRLSLWIAALAGSVAVITLIIHVLTK